MLWQWMYCEIAGQQGRTIAGPEAIRASGQTIDADDISDAVQLLLDSQHYLRASPDGDLAGIG